MQRVLDRCGALTGLEFDACQYQQKKTLRRYKKAAVLLAEELKRRARADVKSACAGKATDDLAVCANSVTISHLPRVQLFSEFIADPRLVSFPKD